MDRSLVLRIRLGAAGATQVNGSRPDLTNLSFNAFQTHGSKYKVCAIAVALLLAQAGNHRIRCLHSEELRAHARSTALVH